MTKFLSERDLDRIAEFASMPEYEREPEQLLPSEDSENETEE